MQNLYAGGYVDGSVTLEAATAINTGAVSVTPTFNNDQFNDQLLVSTVNNDQIKTPSTVDPVSTVSGNNYHDETDIQIRGRNGLDYVFTRTYNSAPSSTGFDRGLGSGWIHSYGMRLKSNDFGICPNCNSTQKPENANSKTSSITYTDERGGEQNFLVNETSYTITNPKGVYDTLTLDSPVAGQHTLTFRNGIKYTFEVPGGNLKTTPGLKARLKYIDNPWGDRLTLSYDALNRLSTITDNLGITGRTGLVFSYYNTNRIKSVNDWFGRTWNYAYTGSDLTGKTNPLNQTITYTYQVGHLLHEIIQPLQRNNQAVKTTFNYYRNGKTFSYHDTLGNTETLSYDLYRKNTRVTDPRDGVREYSYDADGRMTKLIEPDGAVLIFENQGDGIRNKKYDALGYATTYSYRSDRSFNSASDNGGNVSRERDALNHDTDTDYGLYDQVSAIKDKNGHNRRFVYAPTTTATNTLCGDVKGKLKETRADLNGQLDVLLTSHRYDQFGNLCVDSEFITAGNSSRFRDTLWQFDSNNLYPAYKYIVQSDNFSQPYKYIFYGYDFIGRLLSVNLSWTDPTDNTIVSQGTGYQYDALDRVTKVTNPRGDIRETIYDANGQVYQEKDWHKQDNGTYVVRIVATHQYNVADRRISTTDLLGNITKFTYDQAGNVIKVIDANGHTTQYEYDAMNRKTAIIDGNGQRTETKYDLAGHAIAVTNDNNETTKSQYDALGQLTLITNPLGFQTQYKYDFNGKLTCLIDANALSNSTDPGHQPVNLQGCTESRSYDELNRLTQSKDAQGNITATSYNLLGHRTTLTDAENRTTTFSYDDLGRMVQLIDPLIETPTDKIQTFAYDTADNLIQDTDRKGQITQYSYDNLNRNTQTLHLVDNSTESKTYDLFGDLTGTQNAAVSYVYAYTTKHQLQSKTDGRLSKAESWTYDPVGNIDTKTDYQGDLTTYQYDSANRMTAETDPAYLQVSYHYDDAGRLLDRILSNGAKTHYGWDSGGRLTQLQNTGSTGQTVNNTTYTRDRIGNILTDSNSVGATTTAYSYDPEYRLLSADYIGTANDEAYSYDKVGNRKISTKGALIPIASSRYYNYNAGNRMTDIRIGSATGTIYESYGYDDNGSMTGITGNRTMTLTWDANNKVKQINTNTFNYDPAGYRIKKVGSTNNNYYLQGEHLEAIYDNTGTVQAKYLRGSVIDEIVNGYQLDATSKLVNYTYHHDALQSVLGQSGHEGSILATQSYSAFGSILSQSGTSNNAQKYTGREFDSETGLYYYRARYYDPVRGDFISEDPKGFDAGVNFYAYANNNPINANDPSGNIYIFVGGFGDVSLSGGIVKNFAERFNPVAGQQVVYRSWDQSSEIQNLINSQPAGEPINLIGHSYGGDTAATITANSARQINTLITIDPVSLITPNYSDVAKNSNFWMNVNAQTANSLERSNIIAGIGGAWNSSPKGYADLFVNSQANHADFSSMMNGFECCTRTPTNFLSDPNFSGQAANGGFVIYPNKSNTNQMRSVYAK